jgi:hypothetical protein
MPDPKLIIGTISNKITKEHISGTMIMPNGVAIALAIVVFFSTDTVFFSLFFLS